MLCAIFLLCSNINFVDKTLDEIIEQTENLKLVQDALSAPIGAAADFDEVLIFLESFLLVCSPFIAYRDS